MWRSVSLILFILSSCSHGGVRARVCIVDEKSLGFQCILNGMKDGFYLSSEEGRDLLCASPTATEKFFKSCKNHEVSSLADSPFGESRLDRSVCLSLKDLNRIIDRCR